MIVVVFQRGSVDHLLEMNETDGTMEDRWYFYSLVHRNASFYVDTVHIKYCSIS